MLFRSVPSSEGSEARASQQTRYPGPGLQCSWRHFLWQSFGLRIGRRHMQAAFLLLFLLPPPSPGALGLSARHRTRARRAADRHEALVMQGIVGNAVLADEREDLLAGPVEQRVDLDQPVMRIDGCPSLCGKISPRQLLSRRAPDWVSAPSTGPRPHSDKARAARHLPAAD